jgi:hypothetical protein
MPSIVTINVSVTSALAPSTLQSTGAFISQGATTLAANATSLLTQASDLTPLLASPLALSSLVWSGGTVLATTAAAIPGRNTGDIFLTTITGASPTGYNGTYHVTVTGANTFTYALAVNPGSSITAGNYSPPNQGELLAMTATFFGQGGGRSVYVLELGAGDQTTGPALLGTWIQNNIGVMYAFLVPRGWDVSTELMALIAQYESFTSRTYFFVTTSINTYTQYTAAMKCVVALVEAPGVPAAEFSMAAVFQHALAYAPSSSNRMTPFAFSYLFGVTEYPAIGNGALLTALKAAGVNYVGSGAEGGISTAILLWGTTLDGNDFTYWYSADWIQINSDLTISNAIITGSNNPLNPLYYNQNGINVLQDDIVALVQTAIAFGLANGSVGSTALDGPVFQENLDTDVYAGLCVINAVPFITYVTENPSAYKQGVYGGLTLVYIPQRGFTQIIFNINVTQFIVP